MKILQSLIKESLDEFAERNKMVEVAKREFINAIRTNNVQVNVGKGDFQIESNNFTFYVDYQLESDAYYEQDLGSYDREPQTDVNNENDYTFSFFNVTAYDNATNSEVQFIPDEKMMNFIEHCIHVNVSDWKDMPSKEEYMQRFNEF